MTADQNRRRGSARLGAGTVEPGGSPPVYELRLRKKTGRQSILFTLRAPVLAPVASDAAAVWRGQLTSTSLVHIMLPDSFEYSFSRRNGAWTPVAPRIPRMGTSLVWDKPRTGLDLSLTVSAGAVTLRVPDGRRYVFNDKGQLARIEFPDGYMQTLTYTDGLNTLVSDSQGAGWSSPMAAPGNPPRC